MILFALFGALAALLYLYGTAQGLTWQFDDRANLSPLADVSTREALLIFLTGGASGPTGRPLSLLTFLPDYAYWPTHPWGFVRGNLLWHLLNTLLVFLLALRLLRLRAECAPHAMWLALAVAVLWAALPVHSTAILVPVQRMTLVSAFFSLLSLVVFFTLRVRFAHSPGWRSLGVLCSVAGVGLVLSVYAKESGVAVVCFAVLIELAFFDHTPPPCNQRVWKAGLACALLSVPMLLVGYWFTHAELLSNTFQSYREFDLGERLATQPVVLWEYLRVIALPREALIGHHHDGHAIYDWSMWQPWVALGAGVVVTAAALAWACGGSPAGRMFGFAVMFYLFGHLFESTVLPLELYFEHRNYLPVLGIVLFTVYAAYRIPREVIGRGPVLLAAAGFLALNGITVFLVASLWGNPLLAAEMWALRFPDSTRSAQYLAWQYGVHGFDSAALRVLDEFADQHPGRIDVQIQAIAQACTFERDEALRTRHAKILKDAGVLVNPAGITTGLADWGSKVRAEECRAITPKVYAQFLDVLLQHPRVAKIPDVRHHVHYERALTAAAMGDADAHLDHLVRSFHDYPSYSGIQSVALAFFQAGRTRDAMDWIDEAVQHAPSRLAEATWRRQLSGLRAELEKIEAMHEEYEREDREQ
jgi:hypothetical protein